MAPGCISDRKAGTAVVVTRRASADTTPPASATGAYFLQASKCGADPVPWVYSSDPGSFTLHKLDCVTIADIREGVVRSYYISTCNECGSDTTPTLKRAELIGTQMTITPLVEGVENLQLLYGFDTDGDGNPDTYRATLSGVVGAADNDWSNVVSVKLYVLARSTDAGAGLRRQRQDVRSRSGRSHPARRGPVQARAVDVHRATQQFVRRAGGSMMQVNERRQRGATLLVVMVILLAMTWFVLSGYKLSSQHLQIVGNSQDRQQALAAAQRAIEETISSNLFTKDPVAVAATPIQTDIDGDGAADLSAVLSPPPACYRARIVKTSELDIAIPEDLKCLQSTSSGGGVAVVGANLLPTSAGNSQCAKTEMGHSGEGR